MNATKLRKVILSKTMLRGIVSVGGLILLWEVGRRLKLPGFAAVPAPSEVYQVLAASVSEPKFWEHWRASFTRVASGFVAAQIVGIPLGLMMAMSRYFHATTFPLLEIMRPIPPLAWVPASIIFWPTTESSIAFVIFLGAFFTVVINVIGSARNIDVRYLRAAQSLGSKNMLWPLAFSASYQRRAIGCAPRGNGAGLTTPSMATDTTPDFWALVTWPRRSAIRLGTGPRLPISGNP